MLVLRVELVATRVMLLGGRLSNHPRVHRAHTTVLAVGVDVLAGVGGLTHVPTRQSWELAEVDALGYMTFSELGDGHGSVAMSALEVHPLVTIRVDELGDQVSWSILACYEGVEDLQEAVRLSFEFGSKGDGLVESLMALRSQPLALMREWSRSVLPRPH